MRAGLANADQPGELAQRELGLRANFPVVRGQLAPLIHARQPLGYADPSTSSMRRKNGLSGVSWKGHFLSS